MASLKFDKIINLTTSENNIEPLHVNNLCIINEAVDGELVQYFIDGNFARDKRTMLQLANYDSAKWDTLKRRLTARSVSKIGVKAFPGVGSIAYFKYLYNGRSMILCPVNYNKTKFVAPALQMIVQTNSITFTITPPKDITYECYRIILEHEQFAYEYVTYELSLTIPKPDVKGTYSIYCIGYENEGEAISFDSNVISFKVYTGKETFEPDPTISYYTKTEIDELIKSIVKTYTGDNETIDVNQDTGVIAVNADYRKIIESGGGGSTYIADVSTKEITTIDNTTTGEVIAVNTIEILED